MAPPQQIWKGQARIKGYTQTQRMALLTTSLIGLQYALYPSIISGLSTNGICRFVWGIEMSCALPPTSSILYRHQISTRPLPTVPSSHPPPGLLFPIPKLTSILFSRFHAPPPPTRPRQIADLPRLDRTSPLRPHRPAPHRHDLRCVVLTMGQAETVYARVCGVGCCFLDDVGVGGGVRGTVGMFLCFPFVWAG